MKPSRLFVYGTLRHGLSAKQSPSHIMSNATHVGHAKFQGKLYLIDWYPGAIDSDNAANHIVGDLFEIGDNPNLLNQLDIYEGCSPLYSCPHEYNRVVRNVNWGGRSVSAWIYLYAWPLDHCTEIRSGDFSQM